MTPQHFKTSVKLFFVAVTLVAVASVSALAQGGRLSAGGEIAVPLGGYLGDVGSIGIGGFAKWEQPIPSVPNLNWTAQTGFVYFPGQNLGGGYKSNTTAVPFLGGARYYFMDRFSGWYVSGDAGFTFFSSSVHSPDPSFNYYSYGSATRFTFAPGGGYHIANWDFSGRFVLQSDFSYASFRAAYVWNKFGR